MQSSARLLDILNCKDWTFCIMSPRCVDSSLMHGLNLLRWSFCIAHHPGEKKCISSLPPLLLYACMLVHVCKRWWCHCLVGWRKALPDSTVAWLFYIIVVPLCSMVPLDTQACWSMECLLLLVDPQFSTFLLKCCFFCFPVVKGSVV